MLVISRRLKEKILFPDIETAVQVVDIRGSQVRLGIESPPDLVVLREELQAKGADREEASGRTSADESPPSQSSSSGETCHALRNQLNDAGLSIALLRMQLDKGRLEDAEETLSRIEKEFRALRTDLETRFSKPKGQEASLPLPS
jgi:carbon storage regulator